MIRAFFLSLGQLGDPRIAAVFLKSLALTALLLVALAAGLWFGAESLAARYVSGDMTTLAGAAAVLVALALGWLLFRTVAIAVMDIFADDVVVAVERKHYPHVLDTARNIPLARSIGMGLGAAGRAILVNLLMSPIYLTLLITGVGTPIAFILVNGWLLGRDLGDMVAARHMPHEAMRGWRTTTRASRFVLGLAVAVLFVVPILNLLAPILGAAMATHLFHQKGRS
ncbi:MAG: EI24 domain-containing protein [Pseudomonadota bacterium]